VRAKSQLLRDCQYALYDIPSSTAPLGIATTSSALPLAFAGLPLLEFDEPPAGERDLALLALVARIACFVVTVQDVRPIGVAEDTEQNLLTLACLATR